MQIRQHIFRLNDTQLYCETAGSGKPLVFLHGFTLDTRMWDDQFLSVAAHYQAIRYDMRGFGKSALPTDRLYSHVDDLAALLDQMGIEQARLVGLSKGGGVALDFALTYPARTEALVLIDTVLGGFPWSAESSARDGLVWQQAQEGGISAAKESWLAHPLFAPALTQPDVAVRLKQIVDDYSGWHFVNQNPEGRLEPPASQRLAEVTAPLLAIVGEYDTPDFRQVTEFICQSLPHARKLILPGVGHMANMEAPAQVTRAILDFLADL